MDNFSHFSSLIEMLYDAPFDRSGWQRVTQALARAFGSDSCAIHTRDLDVDSVEMLGTTDNIDATLRAEYEDHYFRLDPWVSRYPKKIGERAVLRQEVLSEQELRRTEYYNDWMSRAGQFHILYCVLSPQPGMLGAIGIHRSSRASSFEKPEGRKLDLLLPHLSRALLLRSRLDGLTRDRFILLNALERLDTGVIATDANGNLLFTNAIAERVLRAKLRLTSRANRLHAVHPGKDIELHRLIRGAALAALGRTTDDNVGALALDREDGRSLSLLVCPLRPDTLGVGPSTSAALIFLGDRDECPKRFRQTLIALYGLTLCEAKLVEAMLGGETVQDYAERSGISGHTAKTHLKHAFAKTGYNRQGEMIAALMNDLALRAGGASK